MFAYAYVCKLYIFNTQFLLFEISVQLCFYKIFLTKTVHLQRLRIRHVQCLQLHVYGVLAMYVCICCFRYFYLTFAVWKFKSFSFHSTLIKWAQCHLHRSPLAHQPPQTLVGNFLCINFRIFRSLSEYFIGIFMAWEPWQQGVLYTTYLFEWKWTLNVWACVRICVPSKTA